MATLDLFRHDPEIQSFRAGDVLLQDGSTEHETMYVVVEGEAEIIAHGKVVEHLGPGGMFGEMALIDRRPRSAGVVAKTDGRVVAVDHKRFGFLVSNTPYFAIEVMQVMADRLRRMDERL